MSFSFYTAFTIDHSKCGSSDSSNFPVGIIDNSGLARLKTVGNGGHVQNSSGFDIRPYSDSSLTTALTFELVYYDASTGKIEMWVKIPTLSHTVDTVIYLAYGNAALTTDGSSSSTWDSNFKGVYHLKDGSTVSANDSSQSANNGTINGTVTAVTGQTDGGASVATNSTNNIQKSGFPFSTVFTIESYVKIASTVSGNYHGIITRGSVFENNTNFDFAYRDNGASNHRIACYFNNAGTLVGAESIVPGVSGIVGSWHSIGVSVDSSKVIRTYLDGTLLATSAAKSVAPADGSQSLYLFRPNTFTSTDDWLRGSLDECRISHSVRSDDWILASYNNQNSPSTFYTVGTEQTVGGTIVVPIWHLIGHRNF